jgi:hypothetical protein
MWRLVNHTPYAVGKTWGRDKDGVHEWIVAVKATYDIMPTGRLELAAKQIEPLIAPEYDGEPGLSSLRYDADLVAQKPTTDIVLNATAYAPQGRPSTDFLVGFRVSDVQKTIRVRGNRTWLKGLSGGVSSADAITQLPIVYERAYGGYDHEDPDPKRHRWDSRNPVGCVVVAQSSHPAGQPLPNFEYLHGGVETAGPAGFGAVDCFWSPRREFAGTYDEAWEQNRLPLLPLDWDARSLLCSPRDQQPAAALRGGESVELTNLTPSGRLSFVLPKVHLTFRTRILNRDAEHRARLSSVIIEPDHPRVMLVWTTALACLTNVDYLDQTIVREKAFVK